MRPDSSIHPAVWTECATFVTLNFALRVCSRSTPLSAAPLQCTRCVLAHRFTRTHTHTQQVHSLLDASQALAETLTDAPDSAQVDPGSFSLTRRDAFWRHALQSAYLLIWLVIDRFDGINTHLDRRAAETILAGAIECSVAQDKREASADNTHAQTHTQHTYTHAKCNAHTLRCLCYQDKRIRSD